jgi:hypothetical protein
MLSIRSPRDFGAALLILAVGGAGLVFSSELPLGTASRMGPGYFPRIICWCIIALGAFVGAKSLVFRGAPIERMQLRPIALILVSSLIFGYAIEELGLVIASLAAMLVAPYAKRGANFREALVLSIGLTVFAVIVFAWALGQPLPLWGGR